MLIVDRAVAADPFGGRIRRLLGGLASVPEELTLAPADAQGQQRAIARALARGQPLYIVDNLRLSLRIAARRPRAWIVMDIGDEAASLAWTKGRPNLEVGGLFAAQRLVESRARGIVVRGLGHVGALVTRPWGRPCCLVPDVCATPATWAPKARTGPGVTLGFVGSAVVSPKAPPAGWELPELLRLLPAARGVAVLSGPGEPEIRRRAAQMGVQDRLQIVPPAAPERLTTILDDVDICLSTQTTNLAGQVRTTGKLVEYLALGKVVVASRSGTAAAVLPPSLTVDRDDVFSGGYVRAVADRIEMLSRMPEDRFLDLQRYNRSLALTLFDPSALAPLWLEKMGEWGVISG